MNNAIDPFKSTWQSHRNRVGLSPQINPEKTIYYKYIRHEF